MEYSFVIPCYRSGLSIRNVINEIDNEMRKRDLILYEIIMVNDGSPDNTWDVLKELKQERENRIIINLSKNFGQHAALMAGFSVCSGEFIVTVDDDLQTPINKIWELREKIDSGYDVVSARYTARYGISIARKAGTKLNRFMMKWLIGNPNEAIVSVFMMARKYVIEEIIKYQQPYPYLSGLVIRTTHNIANVEMEQKNRAHGSSGYSFKKLVSLWINGFTAFSLKPLRMAVFFGVAVALLGFLLGIYIVIRKIIYPEIVMGWSSIMSVVLMTGGVSLKQISSG